MNNAKKQRKTIEWERLVISSRKVEIPRKHFMKGWDNKGLLTEHQGWDEQISLKSLAG